MTICRITPDWPQPNNVVAFTTCRQGGASVGSFSGLNLSYSVGDDKQAVTENRKLLRAALPSDPFWIRQIHSASAELIDYTVLQPVADASISRTTDQVCIVTTADCLPVLLTQKTGREVAAIHAGWRGLADGIIANTLKKMQSSPNDVIAWIGPAISQRYFEVGPEVRQKFLSVDADNAAAFVTGRDDRWHADLAKIARDQLLKLGISACYGGDLCTYHDAERFYSYRRDGAKSGRMASLIYLS